MSKSKLLYLSLLLSVIVSSVQAQDLGYLQINCEPGVQIYLNDVYKGETSTEYDGLIIQDLSPGVYTLKATKDNFNPINRSVDIKSGDVTLISIDSFIPRLNVIQEVESESEKISIKSGNLVVQSLPIEINFKAKKLGINETKVKDRLLINSIPSGIYDADFIYRDEVISYSITIKPGMVTRIMANMLNSTVTQEFEDLVDEERMSPYELKWEGDIERAPMVQPLPINSTNSEAVISVRFEVRPNGTVGRIIPLRKIYPELENDVTKALRTWRFSRLPSGVPQRVQWGTITFRFVFD